jgi:hypothetical protein
MTEKKKQTNKHRTQIKDLPKQERKLSKDEQKKVKGGPQNSNFFASFGRTDGSGN